MIIKELFDVVYYFKLSSYYLNLFITILYFQWVTDVAVLPSHGKILVATGGKEIHFYELLTFEFYCVIVGLESVPLMMDVVTLDDDQSYITFGDNQVS